MNNFNIQLFAETPLNCTTTTFIFFLYIGHTIIFFFSIKDLIFLLFYFYCVSLQKLSNHSFIGCKC